MSTFESILLTALLSAETIAPAFVTNGKSVVYLNASEEFTNALVQAAMSKSVVVPTAAPQPTKTTS